MRNGRHERPERFGLGRFLARLGRPAAGPRRPGPAAEGGRMTRLRIALISGHASPLAGLRGVAAGGQNTHVAALSAALARRGHDVRVYTRRDSAALPEHAATPDGIGVVHVPAGPPRALPQDQLRPYLGDFGRVLEEQWRHGDFRPDVVHAHFWLSGLAVVAAMPRGRIPLVLTYHALGSVAKRMQEDTGSDSRIALERMLGRAADV